jgi:hypothetical protein
MSRRSQIDAPIPRDFLKCFGTPEGKRVLFHLRRMYVNTETYVKGDTHDTAYREGKRAVVLTISRQIEIAMKKPIEDPQEENA